MRGDNWHLLKTAHIMLLMKKDCAMLSSEFRPISLMHKAAKITCKILANHLAPELQRMISASQSTFIKGHSIHDNFLYVQIIIKEAHSKRLPLVFLKQDIAKAFNLVRWGYLFDVMRGFGFGQCWIDLMAIMLSSSSSHVMINDSPGDPFEHRRDLRQGDPLSPMLELVKPWKGKLLNRSGRLQLVNSVLTAIAI